MGDVYRIRDWQRFENPTENRRPRAPLEWFAHPTTLTSRGRLRLLREGVAGAWAIVVFEALVALHAQRPLSRRDGKIVNSDGSPIEIEDIADSIHIPAQIVKDALLMLSSERIGWLEVDRDLSEPRQDLSESRQELSLQDRTGHNKTDNTPSGCLSPSAEPKPTSPPKKSPKPTESPDPEREALGAWCAQRWNDCVAFYRNRDGSCAHWPTARAPKKLANLNGRLKEYDDNLDAFRRAFEDRLVRAALAYGAAFSDGTVFTPNLAWILTSNGWEKAGAKPRPEQIEAAVAQRVNNQPGGGLCQLDKDFIEGEIASGRVTQLPDGTWQRNEDAPQVRPSESYLRRTAITVE